MGGGKKWGPKRTLSGVVGGGGRIGLNAVRKKLKYHRNEWFHLAPWEKEEFQGKKMDRAPRFGKGHSGQSRGDTRRGRVCGHSWVSGGKGFLDQTPSETQAKKNPGDKKGRNTRRDGAIKGRREGRLAGHLVDHQGF